MAETLRSVIPECREKGEVKMTMKIKTSSVAAVTDAARFQTALKEAFGVDAEIVHDQAAPSVEAYAEAAVGARLSESVCQAAYLAALAAGVPEWLAYAAYVACVG